MCTLGLLAPGPEPLRFTFPNPPQTFQISPFFLLFLFFFFRLNFEQFRSRRREGPPPPASPLLLAGTLVPINIRRKKSSSELSERLERWAVN